MNYSLKKSINFLIIFCLTLSTKSVALTQLQGDKTLQPYPDSITVAVASERVRFTALGEVEKMRLEVFSSSGEELFDSGFQPGSVREWNLLDGQGQILPDGDYLCVVTIKDLAGKLRFKQGNIIIQSGKASLKAEDSGQLEPPDKETDLIRVTDGKSQAMTVLAHDGKDGQLVSTSGAISFRVGNLFAGIDNEMMRLTEEGNLGIGMKNPQAKLDVDGFIRATQGIVFPDGSIQFSASKKTYGVESLGPGQFGRNPSSGQEHFDIAAAGTGTQNFIAKWTETGGAGTLGNSIIFDNGTNVGISTTTPAKKLDVRGGQIALDNSRFLYSRRTNGQFQEAFGIDSNDDIIFNRNSLVPGVDLDAPKASSALIFGTGAGKFFDIRSSANVPMLRIFEATGNVGIGTSAPAHRLTIGEPEAAQFSSAQFGVFGPEFAWAIARDTTNNVEALFGADFSNVGSANASAVFGSLTNHPVRFITNNQLRMALDTAGNLGIGKEVATARLTVGGTGEFAAAGAARFDLFNIGLVNSGFSQHVTNAGAWQLATTAGATRMLVDSTGNVGIGTITPVSKLTVAGSGSFNAVGAARIDIFNTTANVGYFQHVFNDGRWQLGTGSQTRILVDTAGNVGIGTGPTSKLTVDGEVTSLGSTGGSFVANNPNNQNARALFDWFNDGTNDWPRIRYGGSGEGATNGFLIQGPSDITKLAILNNGRVGIGTTIPAIRLHVTADSPAVSGAPVIESHVALIENTSPDCCPDVLALKIPDTANQNSENNYITFFKGNFVSVGAIEGNGFGGVSYASGGADYAEWLPRLDPAERIQPGEIVGLFGGRVTKKTRGATKVMAISTGPIVLGNDPGEKAQADYEKVAFIGQIMVRVRGAVKAGDFIIASGLNDGTGVAVSPECITSDEFEQAVGQAWESSDEAGVKSVRTAVGLIHRDPTVNRLVEANRKQATQIAELNARLAAIELKIDKKHTARKPAPNRKSKSLQSRAR